MPTLLELYNKRQNKTENKVNNKKNLLDLKAPDYDRDFKKTSVVSLYKDGNFLSSNPVSSQNLLSKYYKEYGYTSLISEAGGFLLGIKSPTSLLQSGLSNLTSGATRGGITSFLLKAANITLRNPFIESTINNVIKSPILDLSKSRITYQSIPPTAFLASNPPVISSRQAQSNLVSATIKNLAISALLPTISGIANSGNLSDYDFERAFGKGLDATEIIILSQQGIKYTKPVAWFDATKPLWSNNLGNYFTYDKYIAYGNQLNYSKIKDVYEENLLDRYNNWSKNDYTNANSPKDLISKSGISNNVLPNNTIAQSASPISNIINKKSADTTRLYQQALGKQVDSSTDPENKYSNRPDIREKIDRLGLPLYNDSDAKSIGREDDSVDKISMLDVGDDYNENLKDTIKFRIYDIFNKEPIIFRAALSQISETTSPTWNSSRYLGRPDNFYTYDSTDREINFTVTVYAQSKREVVTQWRKINRIVGLCYPTEIKDDVAMRGPIVQLTLGDMYNDVYGHFSSVGISIDENYMWDIEDGYQLPMLVQMTIGFKYMYGVSTPQTKIAHFNHNSTKFNIVEEPKKEQQTKGTGALPALP